MDAHQVKIGLDTVNQSIIASFDWLFIWSGNLFILFCVGLVISPFGKIRFGGQAAKADHTFLSWLAMLFAAGMGIGLMFWSVAEPVAYYTGWYETPLREANTPQAAQLAMGPTMFHWGLHPWAIYGVVALSLAFLLQQRFTTFNALGFIRYWAIALGVGRGKWSKFLRY